MTVVGHSEEVISLLQEVVRVEKRTVETGRVNVRIETKELQARLIDELVAHKVDVTRVPVGRFVDEAPEAREEGDVTVIPLVEEVMVKRLFLREEVRITRRREVTAFDETVALRRQTASVHRDDSITTPPFNQGELR